jgi:nucleoside-diphosphate-sugar epimerase
MMKALVIGGTGPTGPLIVDGLLQKGYDVTIYHRGAHEVDLPESVKHIHGDPFNLSDLEKDLGHLKPDLVISSYGRLRYTAKVMAGRCDRFIGITSGRGYMGHLDPSHNPKGFLEVPVSEHAPLYSDHDQNHFGAMIGDTEKFVMEQHAKGLYKATILRYPLIYGPRQLVPTMWPIVKRITDGRKQIIIPGDGLTLRARGYVENSAHMTLLAVDRPEAQGETYNVADEQTLSLKDFISLIPRAMGTEVELVSISHPIAFNLSQSYAHHPHHHLVFDISKAINRLGYKDVVPTHEAVDRHVKWLVANASIVEGNYENAVRDRYDYRLEDEVISTWKRAMKRLTADLPPPPSMDKFEYSYKAGKR